MAKNIVHGLEARAILKKGADPVVNTVAPTLGPKGRNVAYDTGFGGPKVTNDGVSISREIVLEDPLENIGANLIKDVAQKTNDAAGDGTTTSVLLTYSIIEEGLKKIDVGVSSMGIKNGISKAAEIAVDYLKSVAKKIKTLEEINQVATISAESKEIGKMLSETIYQLGTDAVITVETSPTVGMVSEVSQGMEFGTGFISPYMVTDTKRQEAALQDVGVLVTDETIGNVQEIIPFLESVTQSNMKGLVVIAEDVVGDALQTFIVNKLRGSLNVLAIKAPGFGDRKHDYLEDIAAVTGATVVSKKGGLSLKQLTMDHLGSAERIVSLKDKTTIVGGRGDKKVVEERIEAAKKELGEVDSKHDKLKITERVAKLSDGVVVFKVGAASEAETNYLKLKVEDAVNASKAALEEGVVVGGGSALVNASKAVKDAKDIKKYTEDEMVGFDILAHALESPLKRIAKNCGKGDGSSVLGKVLEMDSSGGYDALNDIFVDDMIKKGIADPVKVARSAIENAASAGGTLLTTESLMAEIPKEKSDTPMM